MRNSCNCIYDYHIMITRSSERIFNPMRYTGHYYERAKFSLNLCGKSFRVFRSSPFARFLWALSNFMRATNMKHKPIDAHYLKESYSIFNCDKLNVSIMKSNQTEKTSNISRLNTWIIRVGITYYKSNLGL